MSCRYPFPWPQSGETVVSDQFVGSVEFLQFPSSRRMKCHPQRCRGSRRGCSPTPSGPACPPRATALPHGIVMYSDSRIRAMEDRLAILELEGLYARFFDDHDGAAWAALFTPDGVYRSRERRSDLSTGTSVRGRESLHAFCNDAPYTGIHLMHLPQISIDGDRARSRVHMEWFGSFDTPGSSSKRLVGYYDVEYMRVGSASVWQISDRVTTTFMAESRIVHGYVSGNGLDAADTRRM